MRLLVTGGCGFIGSHFIESFLAGDPQSEVLNVDNMTYASIFKTDFEKRFKGRYAFCKADILDAAKMGKLCKDADIVVNFAAETHVDNSLLRPKSFVETNVLGAATLLDAALKAGHRRFFQISTDEVYGSSPGRPFKETDSLLPSSPYSASKAGAEMLALAYERTYGLSVTITRSSNNYGARQHPEKFMPRIITRIASEKKIPVYGDGKNMRDWLHVSDNCDALRLLLKSKHAGIFNISSGFSQSNIELAHIVLRMMGKGAGEGSIEFIEDRKGHDFCYSIDSSKIRALGWKPKMKFEDGLRETISWYLGNRSAWAAHAV